MSNSLHDWLSSNPRDILPTPVFQFQPMPAPKINYATLYNQFYIPIKNYQECIIGDFDDSYEDSLKKQQNMEDAKATLRNIRNFNK
jgi:hypothetical protein